jgi:hypothetical protein
MMMVIGNHHGITVGQKMSFKKMLRTCEHRLTDVCHGDGVGVEAESHAIVREHFRQRVRIHIFPPEDDELRAHCGNEDGEEVRVYNPTSYLRREKDMLNASNVVIALPFESNEKVRSVTWASIRHARASGRFLCIIYPDGSIQMHKPNQKMRVVKSYDTLKKARKAAAVATSFEEERMC